MGFLILMEVGKAVGFSFHESDTTFRTTAMQFFINLYIETAMISVAVERPRVLQHQQLCIHQFAIRSRGKPVSELIQNHQ
jgi:hypothetical protein